MTTPTPSVKSEKIDKVALNILTKFIKVYNGDRESLPAFLTNCDNAMDLAAPDQQNILCKFIISQLEGKAQLACSLKTFDKWDDLKTFLKTTFGEKKHSTHLLIDLQNCRQGHSETVMQYALRLESCLTRLQADVHYSCTDKTLLPGKIAAMEELALNTFLLNLNPNFSNMVRSRNPSTLSEAISHAVEEEKIFKLSRSFNQKSTISKSCSICHKNGHTSSECYKKKRDSFHKSYHVQQPSTSNSNNKSPVVCAYCKKQGHHINDCRKRQYNNDRRNNDSNNQNNSNHSSFSQSSNSQNSARVHFCENELEPKN